MILRSALCISLTMASSANALSCMEPSVIRSFTAAQSAPEPYYMALGTLDLPTDFSAPPKDTENMGVPYQISGLFSGALATSAGFTHSYSAPVEISVTCMAHWCGGIGGAQEQIFFFEVKGDTLHLEVSPCPGSVLQASAENKAQAIACLKGC